MALQFTVDGSDVEIYHRYPGSYAAVLLKFKNLGPAQVTLTGKGSTLSLTLKVGEQLAFSYDGEGISAKADKTSILEMH